MYRDNEGISPTHLHVMSSHLVPANILSGDVATDPAANVRADRRRQHRPIDPYRHLDF